MLFSSARFRPWLTLLTVVLVYIPVAIDATVLHVATPTLSTTLGASSNTLLWIIDIYSLIMAGMVLPMGALGDKIGFKRLLLTGSALFGIASLAAALAPNAGWLIAARGLLAVGAAMIVPATLAAIRTTFADARQRNIALGIWAAVGSGGAAFGPLIGGFLLAHFYWGAVFLVNVPLILAVMALTAIVVPTQQGRPQQRINLHHALTLVVAILLLIYSLKTLMKGTLAPWVALLIMLAGALLLQHFIRTQRQQAQPMIDIRLFSQRVIFCGVMMAMVAMITLVGFELMMAQELQFVHGLTPLAAGAFMLPVMLSSGISGPVAGVLVSRWGLRQVAAGGMLLSGLSFLGLSFTDFATQQRQAWILMAILGFSVASALLASTAAIMAAAPKEKASAAGAIETMAYELGAGLGIALFGLLLSRSFTGAITLPGSLSAAQAHQASSSIGEAMQLASQLSPSLGQQVAQAARSAFTLSHSLALGTASVLLMLLAVGIWFALAGTDARRHA
ncbi:SmvA family efflux MFS transporter [Shimwellia pseudoproteus]|uniref:SmvA family efflux MFS transporter n=1 Tax=Shimwellia pseudoproteus TaxID=570012 RepID=UPI0018EE358E|nr:SmvA family efflux MFS transporter [Shimwellia pseudoproteus]MBJ3814259.1 SmvA family efflux MFS transporter [Shimwellia pseudoproteus]